MSKDELHNAFIQGIVKHDYSYMYSDYHVSYSKGAKEIETLISQVKELITVHQLSPKDLLDECLSARSEQYKDGLTHDVIRGLFRPYHNGGVLI